MAARKIKKSVPARSFRRHMSYRDLEVVYEGHSQEIPLRVPDLSTQGMFINTPQIFPEGSVLKMKFRLCRTGFLVIARGEVRYCLAEVGIGVEFVEISEEAQQAIDEEIEMAEVSAHRGR